MNDGLRFTLNWPAMSLLVNGASIDASCLFCEPAQHFRRRLEGFSKYYNQLQNISSNNAAYDHTDFDYRRINTEISRARLPASGRARHRSLSMIISGSDDAMYYASSTLTATSPLAYSMDAMCAISFQLNADDHLKLDIYYIRSLGDVELKDFLK